MEDAYGVALAIRQDDRQAIGSLDGQQNSGCAGYEPITGQHGFRRLADVVDEVRMDLSQNDERPRVSIARGTEILQKRRAIVFDRGAGIVPGKAEIEGSPTVGFRGSAQTCADAVNEPG